MCIARILWSPFSMQALALSLTTHVRQARELVGCDGGGLLARNRNNNRNLARASTSAVSNKFSVSRVTWRQSHDHSVRQPIHIDEFENRSTTARSPRSIPRHIWDVYYDKTSVQPNTQRNCLALPVVQSTCYNTRVNSSR